MKKSILFLIVLALIFACSNAPQVTATLEVTLTLPPPPTQTSIPTPTLHPDFLAFQEQIAQSGAYTLNTDGQIEMQTEEGMTIIPDIQVQPDGTMTFTVNGEEFTADPETIKFEGNTFSFKDENGKTWVFDGENWAEAALTPEQRWQADAAELGLDHTKFEMIVNEDGQVEAKGTEGDMKEKVVYRDGAWNINHVAELVGQGGMCEPTEFKWGHRTANDTQPEQWQDFTNYLFKLVQAVWRSDEQQSVNHGPLYDEYGYSFYDFLQLPIENTDQCWVIFIRPNKIHPTNPNGPFNYGVFRNIHGEAIGFPVFIP